MQIQCQAVLPSSLSVLPFSQTEALKLSLNRNSVVVTYVSLSSVSSLSLCLRHLACLQRSTLTPPLSQPDFTEASTLRKDFLASAGRGPHWCPLSESLLHFLFISHDSVVVNPLLSFPLYVYLIPL